MEPVKLFQNNYDKIVGFLCEILFSNNQGDITLSNRSYYQAFGTFIPCSYNNWYVVFLNADSDMQITYLTYDVDFIENPSLLSMIIRIVISFLVVGEIIGACVAFPNKKAHEKRREQELS